MCYICYCLCVTYISVRKCVFVGKHVCVSFQLGLVFVNFVLYYEKGPIKFFIFHFISQYSGPGLLFSCWILSLRLLRATPIWPLHTTKGPFIIVTNMRYICMCIYTEYMQKYIHNPHMVTFKHPQRGTYCKTCVKYGEVLYIMQRNSWNTNRIKSKEK